MENDSAFDKAFEEVLARMQRQRQLETIAIAVAVFIAGMVVGFAFAASIAVF